MWVWAAVQHRCALMREIVFLEQCHKLTSWSVVGGSLKPARAQFFWIPDTNLACTAGHAGTDHMAFRQKEGWILPACLCSSVCDTLCLKIGYIHNQTSNERSKTLLTLPYFFFWMPKPLKSWPVFGSESLKGVFFSRLVQECRIVKDQEGGEERICSSSSRLGLPVLSEHQQNPF